MDTIAIIITVTAFIGGGVLSYFLWDIALTKKKKKAINEGIAEAEVARKEKDLAAKEKFLQLKTEHENQSNERNQKIQIAENRIKQRETSQNQKAEEIKKIKKERFSSIHVKFLLLICIISQSIVKILIIKV